MMASNAKPTSLFSPKKLPKFYTLPLILFLCTSSYFIGLWQHGGTPAVADTAAPCIKNDVEPTVLNRELDFRTHHTPNYTTDESSSAATAAGGRAYYPACEAMFSEYTPCEDQKRSLRFSRERLVYRERHCPAKGELLKCRVPPPHGYRNPFPWPKSRDLAWYANVPHKELTVEKAVQNWIRFVGDRFRFPGGGTMFPNGADAYIDDIGRLINLRDGSIRTAIDTGCGVSVTVIFLYLIIIISFLVDYFISRYVKFFFFLLYCFMNPVNYSKSQFDPY